MARGKKLTKAIMENEVSITEVEGSVTMKFNFNSLPKSIQEKLGPFGLGHKLGDAAAGKSGEDAVKAIQVVWEGLMKGDWSTRAPAAPKVSKASLNEKLSTMSDKEQKIARDLLAKLGLSL